MDKVKGERRAPALTGGRLALTFRFSFKNNDLLVFVFSYLFGCGGETGNSWGTAPRLWNGSPMLGRSP
jgi:hypothetical protein